MISFSGSKLGTSIISVYRDIFSINKKSLNIGLLFLVAVLIGSFTYSTGVFAQAGNNNGNSTMTTDTDPVKRAQSYTLYKVAEECVRNVMRNTIKTVAGENGATTPKMWGYGGSDGNAEQREWFADTDSFGTVYPSSRQNCAEILNQGISVWGFSDGATFLRAMGFTFQSNIPQWKSPSDDGNVRADRFRQAVNGRVGGVDKLTTNEVKHLMYLSAFTNPSTCDGKRVIAYDKADRTQKDWADANSQQGDVVYTVVNIAEGNAPVKYIYTYKSAKSNGTAGQSTTQGIVWQWRAGTDGSYQCNELPKMIRNTAGALADWNVNHPTQTVDASNPSNSAPASGDAEDTTTCAIEGIGWIVCPVATFIGGLNDGLWAILTNLLQIQPRIFDVNGDTYRMWSNIRNIANIAFVIVFIIIIYSQLTGLGVSNYGVKKMLPRLIIAAILVNISFFICALAVDLSNIAGSSLHTMFTKMAEEVSTHTAAGSPVTSWSDMFAWLLSGGAVTWGGVAAVTALGTYGFWGALALLLPSALAALLAFIMVVVLLLARQAFVIILSILAPLALVAYLLPNTNQWFDRWRKFFITLLIMYPTVAILFGGSELAAGVIRAADSSNGLLVIGSLAITALPLFALPALMKASGGLMNRIAGVVNNPNRGPIDKLKKRAEGFTKNQEGRRAIRAFSNDKMFGRRGIQRRARNDAVKTGIEKEANRGRAAYIAQEINDNPDFANRVAGGTNGRYGTNADPSAITRALANAQITIDKVEAEEVSAEKVLIEKLPREEVRKILDGAPVGSARHTAAIQRTVESNDLIKINELWEDKGIQSHAQSRTALADALSRSGSRPAYLGQAQLDDMRRGAKSDGSSISSIQDAIDSSVKAGAYSAEKIAIADKDELQIVRTSPGLSAASKAILKNDSEKAANDKNLRLKISKNREEIKKIIGNDWSP